MATYSWKGTDPRGRASRGDVAAPSLGEAAAALRARGLSPLALERSDAESPVRPTVSADAFTMFNRNLSEMTAVGLPLPRAVREFAAGLRGGRFKKALDRVGAALQEGKTLDEAVGENPAAFPPYYRWMLKAGAASGNLSGMLSAVARNTEGIRTARRAFLEATIYPLLVVFVALLISALGMFAFVPFYRELSASQTLEGPGLPGFLGSVETTARIGSIAIGAAMLAIIAGMLVLRTAAGERILLGLPIVGRIRRHLILARLLGALGVMLRAGVPLPTALPVALGAAGSRDLDRVATWLSAQASDGLGLGEVLSQAPGLSAQIAGFLGAAERSGEAPQSTSQVAELLTEQALSDSEALYILLMPLALLAAGAVVGALLVTLVYPYFNFVDSLHP